MITKYDEFLNESLFNIDREELAETINKIAKHIPPEIIDVLNKSKDKIFPMLGKYVTNGELDLSKLGFLVSVSEGLTDTEWYEDNYENRDESTLYRILKKVFGFPVYAVQSIIAFLKDIFEDGWVMGSLMTLLIAMLMFVVSILGWYTVSAIEAHNNGLSAGDVVTEVEYHRPYTTHQMIGKIPTTTHHPARWTFEVRGIDKKGNERIELWSTTDGKTAEKVHQGHHVNQIDFAWEGTLKK
jgi:hypothetical protein